MPALTVKIVALALLLGAARLDAQLFTRPHLPWSTVETTHFVVHFPDEMRTWTMDVVQRLESVHASVSSFVAYTPEQRITVIVEDPHNISNGFAVPLIDRPVIFLFPTPPTPQSVIGNHRGWGELLLVHELAHIAHLVRPSRNPWQRRLWELLPANLGPVARRSPRWVTEGYATYIEGQLTGAGRPNAAWRAAVLRQWALEGRLPQYQQLNGTHGFFGGAMAYLAGSAYLEWLVAQRGEASLQHLWRRMSARQDRGFVEAFAGVFGAPPDELYGRFTAELTVSALAVERRLAEAGRLEGELVQRLTMRTGDPAVSPDGQHIVLVLRERDRPSRLVVWRTEPEPEPADVQRRRQRALERDPEDVPGIEWRPRPRRPVATLHPSAGRPHDNPRFMPDGERILLTRPEALSDGTIRLDLFTWNFRTGALRRITHGAGIRHADPSPDGRSAVADRCLNGICDLVLVDLETGRTTSLLPGSPQRPFYRPRFSRDGQRVVLSVQQEGFWRLGIYEVTTGAFRLLPGDGEQFDASFLPDGRSIVYVADRTGVSNLEVINVETGARRSLTRVTGGVMAPVANPATGAVFFLNLRSRGFDLNRVHPDSVVLEDAPALPVQLAPAVPRPRQAGDRFALAPAPVPRRYGLGPRAQRLLPAIVHTAEGIGGTVALTTSDPAGRLTWLLQGSAGRGGLWRGGSFAGGWRGTRPWLGGSLFVAGQRPTQQRFGEVVEDALDTDYGGALLEVTLPIEHITPRVRLRAGGSAGRLEFRDASADRRLAFAEVDASHQLGFGRWALVSRAGVHGTVGSTGGEDWTRTRAAITLGARGDDGGVFATATHGRVSSDAPLFEHMLIGGGEPQLFDPALLSQRIAFPALPLGVASGDAVTTVRFGFSPDGGPYYWMGRSEEERRWLRVWGLDLAVDLPPVGFITVPGTRIRSGVAYSVDEPFRRRLSSHVTLVFHP